MIELGIVGQPPQLDIRAFANHGGQRSNERKIFETRVGSGRRRS
jgi:hypothetical protein